MVKLIIYVKFDIAESIKIINCDDVIDANGKRRLLNNALRELLKADLIESFSVTITGEDD